MLFRSGWEGVEMRMKCEISKMYQDGFDDGRKKTLLHLRVLINNMLEEDFKEKELK